jgi:D-alanyl-D-alanine carboxypeptidase/D-alanyl-D-alanine-endopeptidase (penicillin-binding protein 4)
MRNLRLNVLLAVVSTAYLAGAVSCGVSNAGYAPGVVPTDVQSVFNKPLYKGGMWGMRVIDLDTGRLIINLQPDHHFYIGSVRKAFVLGEALNQIGPDYHYDTPVYRQGSVDQAGVLQGDLILAASGDLTMGGRTNPDGSIAFTYLDHNEANTLGNAVLTAPDPLAGYTVLARQIAAAGIREVNGEVAIDDRLFQFNFRNEFNVKPIFVNDDVVDLIINPTAKGMPASITYRPMSAALAVNNSLMMSNAGTSPNINLQPQLPSCIGQPGCTAEIAGNLPIDYAPPITNQYPLIQTFRIVQPSNYARTVFIEELQAAGVKVDAPVVEENPIQILPPQSSYSQADQVALLTGMTFINDAKLVLKVSYNLGADTSLMLWGLTQGVDSISGALAAEQLNLAANYGIQPSEYNFLDGGGGGDTTATAVAVTQMLSAMYKRSVYPQYSDALPDLGVDGSLQTTTDFESDPTLAGAKGQVHAKAGTNVTAETSGLVLVTQDLAGYVNTKSGRHLAFQVVVNNVPITGLNDVVQSFQDDATISAILWRDY